MARVAIVRDNGDWEEQVWGDSRLQCGRAEREMPQSSPQRDLQD